MSDQENTTPASNEDDNSTANPLSGNQASPAVVAGEQASIGLRVGATLIDSIAVSIVTVILSTILGIISSSLGILAFPVYLAGMLLRDSLPFLDGQSLGKKILGLRAVTTDGKSLSGDWKTGAIRNVPLIIPIFPIVELVILIQKKDAPEGMLRFGDQWAGTKVITAK